MHSNFTFLNNNRPGLAEIAMDAEDQLYYDNQACILKLGTFAEKITEELMYAEGLEDYIEENQFRRVSLLEEGNVLPENIKSILHKIRILRNRVAHENEIVNDRTAEKCMRSAYELAGWFMVIYCRQPMAVPEYIPIEKCRNGGTYNEPEDYDSYNKEMYTSENTTENTEDKKENSAKVKVLTVFLILSAALNIYLLAVKNGH